MANHRMPKKRRARQSVLAAAAAAGLSSALVFGLASNSTVLLQLTASTAITAGGLSDTTSIRVQNKLRGMVIPSDYDQVGVDYPATTNLSGSRDLGTPVLLGLINTHAADQSIFVVSYSEGTLLAEQAKRDLQNANTFPLPSQLSFVSIASPFAGNGGIFARFPGIGIPGVIDPMGPAAPSRYDTTYYTNEYDTYGDFPAYFNPLALLNTALGLTYSHPDPAYDPVDPTTAPRYVTTVPPSQTGGGGTNTYVMFYAQQLPLLAPLRGIAAFTGTTAFVEPFLSAIEPLLRVLVDMAYTDRVNANPTAATPFSLITPPEKFLEALGAIPGALAQGVQNFLNGGQTPVALPNPINNLQTTAPVPAPVVPPQVQTSPLRLGAITTGSSAVSTEPAPTPTPTVLASTPSATATPTATPTPTATQTPSPSSTSAAAATLAATPTKTVTPVDGLHPTQTSDGNLFKPGDVAAPSSTRDGATTTTTTTTTTGSGTTTTPGASTPTGGTAPAAADDKNDEKAGEKAGEKAAA